MSSRFLVLDIDDRGIDARTGRDHFFQTWADLPGSDDKDSRFQTALDAIAGHLNLNACDEAVVMISSRNTCFRNISLPFKNDSKIRQVLPLELAPYLPFADESFVFDYLLQDLQFLPEQHLFLTAAIPEQLAGQVVTSLGAFKKNPRLIIPKGYAKAVFFLENQKKKPDLLFLYTGCSETTLILVVKGKPMIVRSLPPTGPETGKLVHAVFQTVTGFRQKSGLDMTFEICIAFETRTQEQTYADTIRKTLSEQLSANQTLIKQISLHEIDPDSEDFSMLIRSRLRINFCQGIYGAGSFFQKFKTELVTLTVIGLVALGLNIYSLKNDITRLETAIAAERKKMTAIYHQTFPNSPVPGIHAPLLLMQARVNEALKKADSRSLPIELTDSSLYQAIDVLYQLSENISENMPVKLSRLLLNRGQLTIAGATNSFYTVDRLKTVLEQSTIFKTVTLNTAEAGNTEDQVLFNFKIEI